VPTAARERISTSFSYAAWDRTLPRMATSQQMREILMQPVPPGHGTREAVLAATLAVLGGDPEDYGLDKYGNAL
jgi:hypothetical protein